MQISEVANEGSVRASEDARIELAPVYRGEGLPEGFFAGSICAFGVFDGVHNGHRFIIDEARKEARARGAKCFVLTFDLDPDELFNAARLKKLMPNERRMDALAARGVDGVVAFPFTREFAALDPEQFLEATFGTGIPAAIHVGYDFRFGAKAAGEVATLVSWGSKRGMRVEGHDLLEYQGAPITSTRIRLLLEQGKVREVQPLLGAPYAISGRVRAGRGEGRDFGFRTANLHVPDMLRALSDGVYACYAHVDGVRYKAAVSVGVAPTFEDQAKANVEVHILDFEGNLYEQDILVEFIEWLRPMMKFESTEQLIATVMSNIQWTRDNL